MPQGGWRMWSCEEGGLPEGSQMLDQQGKKVLEELMGRAEQSAAGFLGWRLCSPGRLPYPHLLTQLPLHPPSPRLSLCHQPRGKKSAVTTPSA